MWDWLRALYDGGIQLLFGVVALSCVATYGYRHFRDWRREWWEEASALLAVFVLFAAYPAWHLMTDGDQWRRIAIGEEPSALTYGKMLWLDLWGVALGRVAYSALSTWILRM